MLIVHVASPLLRFAVASNRALGALRPLPTSKLLCIFFENALFFSALPNKTFHYRKLIHLKSTCYSFYYIRYI